MSCQARFPYAPRERNQPRLWVGLFWLASPTVSPSHVRSRFRRSLVRPVWCSKLVSRHPSLVTRVSCYLVRLSVVTNDTKGFKWDAKRVIACQGKRTVTVVRPDLSFPLLPTSCTRKACQGSLLRLGRCCPHLVVLSWYVLSMTTAVGCSALRTGPPIVTRLPFNGTASCQLFAHLTRFVSFQGYVRLDRIAAPAHGKPRLIDGSLLRIGLCPRKCPLPLRSRFSPGTSRLPLSVERVFKVESLAGPIPRSCRDPGRCEALRTES